MELDKFIELVKEQQGIDLSGVLTTADKIDRPERALEKQAIDDFMDRNPMAGGGMLVQPSADGSRPGYSKDKKKINRDESYRKVVKDFVATSGPGTGKIFDDPAAIEIVKANLNKIKKQRNNKALFEWSEDSDWYRKLRKELNPNTKTGTNREYTNKLINQVVDEFFPGAYHGKNAIKNFRNDMVVKSFIQHLKSVGEFDGQEKFDKVLDQFTYRKDGKRKSADHLYEDINKSWNAWRKGEFEVDGIDRAELRKELKARGIDYSQIDNWKAAQTQKRGTEKIAEIKFLDNQNSKFPNRSLEQVEELFKKKFPNSNFYLRVNNLTEIKRNGVYVSGATSERSITGIDKGDRAGWLKKAYGKQFAGNYSKIINAADQLAAAGETAKAERLYKAADKFFGPTGIVRKSAVGEAEHALARSFDFLNPDRQLAINSIVDGDLNQFKKNLFDIPVKRYFDEYNKPETTKARRVELKNLIEERKKIMNAITGGQKSGIVAGDIVNFRYGANEITATSSVKPIDTLFKEGKFDINEYIERGNKYTEAFQAATKDIDIKKDFSTPINENKFNNLLAKIGCPGKGKAYGGRIQFQEGLSPEICMKRGADVIKEKRIDSPAQKANFNKMMKMASVSKNMALLKDVLGPYGLGGDVLLEGMIAVNKTLTGGTPFKESWQDSWLSNIVGGAYDEKGQKLGRQKLFELRSGLSSGAQEFGDYNRKVEEYYKLIEQRNNLEAMSGGGAFDYVGNLAGDVRQINNKIKVAERELGRMETRINAQGGFDAIENEFNRKTAERQDADAANSLQSIGRQFVDANQLNEMLQDDFSGLSSDALPMQRPDRTPLTSYMDFKPDLPTLDEYKEAYGDLAKEFNIVPPNEQQMQQEINQEKFRQLFNQPGFMGASDTFFGDSINMAKGGRAGFKSGTLRKGLLALIDESVKSTPKDTTSALDKLIKQTLDEDLFDKKDRIIDSINISEANKRRKYSYNQQVFEEPKNLDFYDAITKSNFRTKTGPYFDRIRRLKRAGGGLLKQAGDRSGAPPESGPNPQGLQGLLNRVKNT